MVRGSGDVGRDVAPESTGDLCRYAEVPPTGVGLRKSHCPGSRSIIPSGGGQPKDEISPGNIPRGGDTHSGAVC